MHTDNNYFFVTSIIVALNYSLSYMISGCLIAAILVRLTDLIPSSIINSDIGDVCGAEYCSEEMYFYNESLYVPTIASGTSRVLVSIWLGLAVLGLGISCAFLDSRLQEPQANHDRTSVKDILKSVKCAFQDPKLQLAAPLTLFIGLEQGFIYADFMEVNEAIRGSIKNFTFASFNYYINITINCI